MKKIYSIIVSIFLGILIPAYAMADYPDEYTCAVYFGDFIPQLCNTIHENPTYLDTPEYFRRIVHEMIMDYEPQGYDQEFVDYYINIFRTPGALNYLQKIISPCKTSSFNTEYVSVFQGAFCGCPDGYVLELDENLQIPRCYEIGIYQDCEVGKYRGPSNRCIKCPENGTTAGPGAESRTECYVTPQIDLKDAAGTFHYKSDCHLPN